MWVLRKVAIRLSHRKQCLIVTSFDIVPSAPLHLNQFFLFFFSIKKLILSLNTSNLYKLQTFFLIKAVLPPICWRVFLAMNLLTCLPCHQFVDVSTLPPICWRVFLATNLLTCLPCHQFIDVSSLPSICWRVFLAINLLTCLPWWPSHSPDIYQIKANSVSNSLHFPERQLYCQIVESAFALDILNV